MREKAEFYFKGASQLPAVPELAAKLVKTLGNEDATIEQICSLVQKDPALSAKVLRLANSARYAHSRSVSKLSDAASALGLDALRNLALGASLCGAFPSLSTLPRSKFWRHCLASARHAQVIAKLVGADSDAAYLAGLMARTGQLLMAMSDPSGVAQVEEQAKMPGDRRALERQAFGCSHAEVSACLAEHWLFPSELAHAYWQASVDPLGSKLSAALAMAELASDARELGLDPLAAIHAGLPQVFDRTGLASARLGSALQKESEAGSEVEELLR